LDIPQKLRKLRVEGKVGIGTTSPGTVLEIVDEGDPTLRIKESSSDGKAKIQLLETGGQTDGIPRYGHEISYDGDENKFHISSFNASTTKRDDLTIVRSTGNVGIGFTSPTHKFEVQGLTRFTVDVSDAYHVILGNKFSDNFNTRVDIR
jgi:hypothetical protein